MPTPYRKPCPNEALYGRMEDTKATAWPIDGQIVVPLALWEDLMAAVCCDPILPDKQCALCRGRERSRRYQARSRHAMGTKEWSAVERELMMIP